MAHLVVPGTVEAIFSNGSKPSPSRVDVSSPILQILSVKPIAVPDGTPRVRIILSDGRNYMQAMLNTVLNSFALSDAPVLVPNAVIRISSYTINKTKDKRHGIGFIL